MQFRSSSRSNARIDQAYVYAELGVRHAICLTHQADSWRSLVSNGTWLSDVAVDGAVYSVAGIDPDDGDIGDDDYSHVILTCTSELDGVSRVVQVEAAPEPLEIMGAAVASKGNFYLYNYAIIEGDVLSDSNVIRYSSKYISGNVTSRQNIWGFTTVNGTISSYDHTIDFPTRTAILNFFIARGTVIPYQRTLYNRVLSTTSNPFGQANPEGVYVMYCNNRRTDIEKCRITGTLVIIEASDGEIEDWNVIKAAHPNYPSLVLDTYSNYEIILDDDDGSYINDGIICTNELYLKDECAIQGPVISLGNLIIEEYSVVTADPERPANPYPYCVEPHLLPVANTWREVVSE